MFRRRQAAIPVVVNGVLVNPQNVELWGECWLLPNALEASGLMGWAHASEEVEGQGTIRSSYIRSPTSGITWRCTYGIVGQAVRYTFAPQGVDPSSAEVAADAAVLSTCCNRRGGVL